MNSGKFMLIVGFVLGFVTMLSLAAAYKQGWLDEPTGVKEVACVKNGGELIHGVCVIKGGSNG